MAAAISIDKLLHIPICRGLTEEEAQSILQIAEDRSAQAGEVIFNDGDPGDAVYVLIRGQVEVVKNDSKGVERALAKLGDHAVLGEMSMVVSNARRSATARALSQLTLLKIPATRFRQLLGKDDLGALKMVHNFAQVMSRRLMMMDEKIVEALARSETMKRGELGEFSRLLQDWSF